MKELKIFLEKLIYEYREKERNWKNQTGESEKALGREFGEKADMLGKIKAKLITDNKLSLSPETCNMIMDMFSNTAHQVQEMSKVAPTQNLRKAFEQNTNEIYVAWKEFEVEKNKN